MATFVKMSAIAVAIGLTTLPLVKYLTQRPKARATLRADGGEGVNCLVFSPDGKSLACGGRTVYLWDLATLRVRSTLASNGSNVFSVTFAPDGKTLGCAVKQANSTWGGIVFWDLASGQRRGIIAEGPEEEIRSLAFSPDGGMLAFGSTRNRVMKLWDVAAGQERTVFGGHTRAVVHVAFSPDGKALVSAGLDGIVNVWDWASPGKLAILEVESGGGLRSIAFSPDSKTLACTCNSHFLKKDRLELRAEVKLLNVALGKEIARFEGHTAEVLSVAFSPDGKTIASGSKDGTAVLWDVATGKQRAVLKGHTGSVTCVAFSPDGKTLASGSDDGTVKVWDVPVVE